MILGLSIPAFTQLHVIISLIAIASGLVWLVALTRGRWLPRTNLVFLVTTILTSITGFMFPLAAVTPAVITGVVSLAVLAVSVAAIGPFKRHGVWNGIYALTAAIALWLNCFVLVVQSFLKIGPLNALAPTQTEPAFAAAQGLVLVALVLLGFLGVRRSRTAVASA
ncbi:hypothetical protein [Sphingomonas sp. SRS2]|uniref:hypothetical protein n=1 Tax=Sphingomonas sp. SRS2 TaxID=133190 RepID=UPI00061844A0|nr:hypothetical protein [Sphingomonas sp. SRS2]KKC26274.1 membrane protein [Sphingomonas sp. SRS2]